MPDLSRFELQCLRKFWCRKEATVRQIRQDLTDPPSYSTVRKIVERLEQKGAIERIQMIDKAWTYRSRVGAAEMLHKEIRRFLDVAFDGAAAPLISHLAEMEEISLADLREIEARLSDGAATRKKSARS